MFNRVGAVVLFVEDFQTSLKFYRDTLGLEVVVLEGDFAAFKLKDQNFAMQGMSASAEMIGIGVDAFEPQHSGKADRMMLCAEVEDVDATYETLKGKGVEFTRPPVNQPWGLRAAYFRDPEGNIWEFYHPLES